MNKIEHIGIAVKNLEESENLFSLLLKSNSYKRETVESEGIVTSFFKSGDTKIELLASQNNESPIAKFIEKRGEGIHHIAFEVDDIEEEINRLEQNGFALINKTPKQGADNKIIAFLHPKSTNGVLVELCMSVDRV
ncbi:MAG: methylmalonyl-CoA epimerase [Bacteroidia bacterium]|nr:methylmalonyl-CoA epimerase [Bacteroidia bacterium]